MSFHLNQLRFASLVTSHPDSRSIIYSANFKAMNDLQSYLMKTAAVVVLNSASLLFQPAVAPEVVHRRRSQKERTEEQRMHLPFN
jgi:hypothetical protein